MKKIFLFGILVLMLMTLTGCPKRPETSDDLIVPVLSSDMTSTPTDTPVSPAATPTPTPTATETATPIIIVASPTPASANTPVVIIVTATPATIPTVTAPITETCTLPADEAAMPMWLANNFGGSAEQWRRKIDQATGLALCAWEFLSSNRELGIGPNATLLYREGASGTVHYGVRNAAATAWLAAYLVAPGDFTVAQVGKATSVAIDTATWTPGAASPEQIAARTPGSARRPAATQTPVPAARPTASGGTINQVALEALTGGPARFWVWIVGDTPHWEFKSGDQLFTLTLSENLPSGVYISFGKETSPGKWEEARITRRGESSPPLNQASFLTP